jgi:diguanylate cyclase (GGDEF)-like protein
MPRPTPLAPLADLVLTREPVTRGHLALWLTSATTYVIYTLVMWLQVALGYTPVDMAVGLSACALVVNTAFYFGIRHGWGPPRDRNLGVTQLLVGIVFMWLSYAAAGPASGTTLIIVASHIVYAMFGMRTRRVWQIVGGSLAGLALTMLLCNTWQPERYPAGQQWVGLCYTSLVVVLIARLTTLVSKMHEGLRSQRAELARALDKVNQLATRDDLTQVHNRRHVTELMRIEQARHERHATPLCLALLDIDFFKIVNDTFGHHAGDEVLRRFAQSTLRGLRTADLLGRWGGEEFVVLFPDTSLAHAQVALQRVREQLRQTDFSSIDSELRISFSAGLVLVGDGERIEAAVERADQAMYRAKARGRDCVEIEAALPLPAALPAPLRA